MAIARTKYAEIHDLVKIKKLKVVEVAAKYGCSANNIYYIVSTEVAARETAATIAAAVAVAQATVTVTMSGPIWEHPRAVPGNTPNVGGSCLVMRSPDGEEIELPFRSLDELLSSAKPILRQAARCGDEIWFTIREAREVSVDIEDGGDGGDAMSDSDVAADEIYMDDVA